MILENYYSICCTKIYKFMLVYSQVEFSSGNLWYVSLILFCSREFLHHRSLYSVTSLLKSFKLCCFFSILRFLLKDIWMNLHKNFSGAIAIGLLIHQRPTVSMDKDKRQNIRQLLNSLQKRDTVNASFDTGHGSSRNSQPSTSRSGMLRQSSLGM